jgi:hypothetical protein
MNPNPDPLNGVVRAKGEDIPASERPEPPANWLKGHDRWLMELPDGDRTDLLSLFSRVRLRYLAPLSSTLKDSADSEGDTRPGAEVFLAFRARGNWVEQETARWETRLQRETPRVLERLSAELRPQLAALVADTVKDFEIYDEHRQTKRRVKQVGNQADPRNRMLNGKTLTARTALMELHDYAAKQDPVLGHSYKRAATYCLKELDRLDPAIAGAHFRQQYARLQAGENHPVPDDPKSENMVKLYCFFKEGCDLTAGEAEVRTGLIRNAFWKDFADPVDVHTHYGDGESSGCTAVRLAVQRNVRRAPGFTSR